MGIFPSLQEDVFEVKAKVWSNNWSHAIGQCGNDRTTEHKLGKESPAQLWERKKARWY